MTSPESTELLTFEDILKRVDYVICDSSVFSPAGFNWYMEGVYEARDFAAVNSRCVRELTEYLKYLDEFFQNKNIFAVPGVSLELKRASDMVADKIRYLKLREKSGKDRKHHNGENKLMLLQEAHDLFHRYHMHTRRISFLPRYKGEYDVLEKIVMRVTENTGAKIDLHEVYNTRAKPRNIEDFHADEQAVAASLYLSLAENKEIGILTKDSDIRRILGNTLSYLFYSEKSQFNDFLSWIRANKIEVYFVSSFQQAKLVFDTDSFCPVRKISGEVTNNIDSKLNNL